MSNAISDVKEYFRILVTPHTEIHIFAQKLPDYGAEDITINEDRRLICAETPNIAIADRLTEYLGRRSSLENPAVSSFIRSYALGDC